MAGYSSNPLFKKLGLKAGAKARIINAPANYPELIGEIKDQLSFHDEATPELDFIHVFTNSLEDFEKELTAAKRQIKKDGMIWISWYKRGLDKVPVNKK